MLMSPCKVDQVFLDCSALWDCNCNGFLFSNNVLAQFVMSVFVDLNLCMHCMCVCACVCVYVCAFVCCVCVCVFVCVCVRWGKGKYPENV